MGKLNDLIYSIISSLNGKSDQNHTHELSQMSQDSTHRVVTDTEKSTWNAKSNFSGNYNDLSNKPTIPTVPTKLSQLSNDKTFMTKAEIEALIESVVLNGYLGGYRLRVANDSGKTGYITVKKG